MLRGRGVAILWKTWSRAEGVRTGQQRAWMSGTFRAVCVKEFGGPEVLAIEEVATPSPQKGQVVVDIKAAGVNPVDTYIRSGSYPRKPDLPWTPGSDGAGVISAVGEDVNSFKVLLVFFFFFVLW